MTNRWLIGLTSGSGADGVDAALLEIEGVGLDLQPWVRHALHLPFARDLRDLVQRLTTPQGGGPRFLGLAHRLLGETFAAAACQVADQASLSLQKVQCIGC